VDIDAARLFQQPFHLVQAGVEPNQVAWHAAFPDVGERAHLVLVAEDDVILPARKEGRVDVNQIDALAGQLAHHMQVVAPDESVHGQVGVSERDALHDLERQADAREEFVEALALVPAERLFLDGDRAESHRRSPELFLFRQGFDALLFVGGRDVRLHRFAAHFSLHYECMIFALWKGIPAGFSRPLVPLPF
jgi:hypothetical protein